LTALEAVVYGLIQGFTEFLPVSSSAHLRIVPALFGWPDPGAGFTAVIQLGTVAAVLLYFRRDLWTISAKWAREIRVPFRKKSLEAKLGWFIVAGTVPISVFGLAFRDEIESSARALSLVGWTLIGFSLVMLAAERMGTKRRQLSGMGIVDAAFIGAAQALALVPGFSRSGSTISAGLFKGFDRCSAARYSFLLSIPAVVLSGLFEIPQVGEGVGASATATAIAAVVAFVSGYAAIAWLLRYLGAHTLYPFAGYRVLVGAAILLLAATGVIV